MVESKDSTINRLYDLQNSFKQNPLQLTTGMQFDDQYKYVTWKVDPKKFKTIELMHITDIQFGHKFCNVKRMIEYRDWILSEPNRFMLWGGDMIDAGTKVSVGSPWEQVGEPQSEIYQFCKLWAPARHRILGFVGGNHERRGILTFGDLGTLIASVLQVPYSAGVQLVDIDYGQHKNFRVSLWHGKGASTTAGAQMMMLDRFIQSGDSQLYLVGHLHSPMTRFIARPLRQPDNKIKLVKVGGAMSSSFLDYFGTYAEVMSLPSTPLMMARAVLEPNGHWELTLR
jgi:hypothetical protein